jgi:hypothetical protein
MRVIQMNFGVFLPVGIAEPYANGALFSFRHVTEAVMPAEYVQQGAQVTVPVEVRDAGRWGRLRGFTAHGTQVAIAPKAKHAATRRACYINAVVHGINHKTGT